MYERNPHEPRNEQEQAAFDAGAAAMTAFIEVAKRISSRKDVVAGMLHAFVEEHRTNQQLTARTFVELLQTWGARPKATIVDGRNEATWEFARKLMQEQPYFPHV